MKTKQYIQPITEVATLVVDHCILSESNPFNYGGGGGQGQTI